MENLRATGRRLKHALLDKASKLKKTVGLDRSPRTPLPERMVRRYSLALDGEMEESRSTTRMINSRGKLQPYSESELSSENERPTLARIKARSRRLSVEEGEMNQQKLAKLGTFMSVFYDDEGDANSDQDSLIEELQDIGYFYTSEESGTKTPKKIVF